MTCYLRVAKAFSELLSKTFLSTKQSQRVLFLLQPIPLTRSFSPWIVMKLARSHLSLHKAAGNLCKELRLSQGQSCAVPVSSSCFHSSAQLHLLSPPHPSHWHNIIFLLLLTGEAPRLFHSCDFAAWAHLPLPSTGARSDIASGKAV